MLRWRPPPVDGLDVELLERGIGGGLALSVLGLVLANGDGLADLIRSWVLADLSSPATSDDPFFFPRENVGEVLFSDNQERENAP